MAYGERTFEGDMNISPFFEFLWGQRKSQNDLGLTRLYPWVPPLNPFNVCNPDAEGGMDCGSARDELWTNPGLRQTIMDMFGGNPGPGGSCDLRGGPIGPQWVRPFVSVKGDRNIDESIVSQTRIVGESERTCRFSRGAPSRTGTARSSRFIRHPRAKTSRRVS